MVEKFRVQVLNQVSANGLKRLPWERFTVSADVERAGRDPAALGRPARVDDP